MIVHRCIVLTPYFVPCCLIWLAVSTVSGYIPTYGVCTERALTALYRSKRKVSFEMKDGSAVRLHDSSEIRFTCQESKSISTASAPVAPASVECVLNWITVNPSGQGPLALLSGSFHPLSEEKGDWNWADAESWHIDLRAPQSVATASASASGSGGRGSGSGGTGTASGSGSGGGGGVMTAPKLNRSVSDGASDSAASAQAFVKNELRTFGDLISVSQSNRYYRFALKRLLTSYGLGVDVIGIISALCDSALKYALHESVPITLLLTDSDSAGSSAAVQTETAKASTAAVTAATADVKSNSKRYDQLLKSAAVTISGPTAPAEAAAVLDCILDTAMDRIIANLILLAADQTRQPFVFGAGTCVHATFLCHRYSLFIPVLVVGCGVVVWRGVVQSTCVIVSRCRDCGRAVRPFRCRQPKSNPHDQNWYNLVKWRV